MEKGNCLREVVLYSTPRALGLGDRDNSSSTYGCFDRIYWHYNLIDFPNSRFQEVCQLLALLYSCKFPNNRYYKERKLLEWAKAAMLFWEKIQRRDGSLDEAYPFEHSFVATAFTTHAVTESLILLKSEFSIGELKTLEAAIRKSGDWLIKEDNFEVANQMAAAAASLLNIYILTNEKKYLAGFHKKLEAVLNTQTKEGYFPEYGGWDLGYLSITINYLSYIKDYLENTDKEKYNKLMSAMNEAARFTKSKIRTDGTYSSAESSRNTTYLYPYGLCTPDASIMKRIQKGLLGNRIINPTWMDDRFFIPFTISYLKTEITKRK